MSQTIVNMTDEQKELYTVAARLAYNAEVARRDAAVKANPGLRADLERPQPESKAGCGINLSPSGKLSIVAGESGGNVHVAIWGNPISGTSPNPSAQATFSGTVSGQVDQPFDFNGVLFGGEFPNVVNIIGVQYDLRLEITSNSATVYFSDGTWLVGTMVAPSNFGSTSFNGSGSGQFQAA